MGRPSNTMEYAYDDWCLAQMANHLGHTDDYNYFLKRSANWTNLFDTETGFIRLKIRMAIGFLLLTLIIRRDLQKGMPLTIRGLYRILPKS